MSGDTSQHSTFGKITSGIGIRELPLQTINFVREQLPAWRDDPDRPDEKSEPKLNLQLCKYLDRRARNDFPMVQFAHEELQGGHRSVDISATAIESKLYPAYDPFIVFECKRLPPPSKDREKEYLTGENTESGGIQRFKLGLHAENLQIVAMIGYIQRQSVQHWHGQINQWISELSQITSKGSATWTDNDKLESLTEDLSNGVADCKSVHQRTDPVMMPELTIYHLWIMMKPMKKI